MTSMRKREAQGEHRHAAIVAARWSGGHSRTGELSRTVLLSGAGYHDMT